MSDRPVTISEPIYNTEGFGVGFRIRHPESVECVFPPPTHQCSCGRLEIGVVRPNDETATEPSPDQS